MRLLPHTQDGVPSTATLTETGAYARISFSSPTESRALNAGTRTWKDGLIGYFGEMETTIMENQMEKKMENEMETREYIGLYSSYIGIMENKMETTIVYWGNLGTMEN